MDLPHVQDGLVIIFTVHVRIQNATSHAKYLPDSRASTEILREGVGALTLACFC